MTADGPSIDEKGLKGWLHDAARASAVSARRLWTADVLHYSASLAAVQGGAFVAQLIVARLLGPAEFGYVRIIDTTLAILLIPAGIGMASAAVRYIAAARTDEERSSLLSMCLAIVLVASIVVGVLATGLLRFAPISVTAVHYLLWMVWLLVFANVSRVVINYFQGLKQIRRVAVLNVGLACVGALAVVGGARWWSLTGWAGGRMIAEGSFAVVLVWTARGALTVRIDWTALRPVLVFGTFLMLSAALDRVAVTADTLYLDAFVRDPAVVGQYGAAVLATNLAGLLPAAATAVALPRVVERVHDRAVAWAFAWDILGKMMLAIVALAGVLAVMGPWAIRLVLGNDYQLAGRLLQGLSPTFVLNSLVSFLGIFLLAAERADLALVQSALGVGLNIAANALLIPVWGVWGSVWAGLGTAAIRAATLAWFAFRVFRLKHVPR
jgi:O-antigen/teichoic acid export membrane protein